MYYLIVVYRFLFFESRVRRTMVRFFIPDGVFLPCDHGLDFFHQLISIYYVADSAWLCVGNDMPCLLCC